MKYREFVLILKANGFELDRERGCPAEKLCLDGSAVRSAKKAVSLAELDLRGPAARAIENSRDHQRRFLAPALSAAADARHPGARARGGRGLRRRPAAPGGAGRRLPYREPAADAQPLTGRTDPGLARPAEADPRRTAGHHPRSHADRGLSRPFRRPPGRCAGGRLHVSRLPVQPTRRLGRDAPPRWRWNGSAATSPTYS